MKLTEITGSNPSAKTLTWVALHLREMYNRGEIGIQENGTIDAESHIIILDNCLENGALPVTFNFVKGDFKFHHCPSLISLAGCPRKCEDFSALLCSSLTSLEGMPEIINGVIDVRRTTSLHSFEGIADYCKKVDGHFNFTPQNIKSGGLGLILIKGLRMIHADAGESLTPPFRIIEKYLGKPDEVFECQNELIEAGYEEYAKL